METPVEKELYSIKPLEWQGINFNGTLVFEAKGMYMKYEVWPDMWRRYLHDPEESFIHGGDCVDYDDGKRQAQDHFNSKLKLFLNRELK